MGYCCVYTQSLTVETGRAARAPTQYCLFAYKWRGDYFKKIRGYYGISIVDRYCNQGIILDTQTVYFPCAVVYKASCTTHRGTPYKNRSAFKNITVYVGSTYSTASAVLRFQPLYLEVQPRVCDSCRDRIRGPRRIRTAKNVFKHLLY